MPPKILLKDFIADYSFEKVAKFVKQYNDLVDKYDDLHGRLLNILREIPKDMKV